MGMTTTGKFKYDKIIPFMFMDYTVAILNGRAGLIDLKGNPLTDFIYDDLSDYYSEMENSIGMWMLLDDNQNFCSLRLNGKWGFLDKTGRVLIDFKYDDEIYYVNLECENYYFVRLDNKWAVYNRNWQKINDDLYENINAVNNHIVFKKEKYGVMDLNGNITIEPKYHFISSHLNIAEGFWVCKKDDKYGIINYLDEVVINFEYSNLFISNSKKYIAAARYDNNKYGIIDFNNNVIVDFIYGKIEFCEASNIKDEYFLAYKDDKNILLNSKGERLI